MVAVRNACTKGRTPRLACLGVLLGGCVEPVVPMPEGTTGNGPFWSALYGPGIGVEEMEAAQAVPGGVVVAGFTDGFSDEAGDAWLLEIGDDGAVRRQVTVGRPGGEEMLTDVRVLPDGGLVGTGWTKASGAGGYDLWVLRLDAEWNVVWSRAYGGKGAEQGWGIAPTQDGGYAVAGGTTSFGGGDSDLWILRLDGDGMPVWQQTLGGPEDDAGSGDFEEFTARIVEDADGNLVASTETFSFGAGDADIWVVKLDPTGAPIWQLAVGGPDEDTIWSMALADDGTYLLPAVTSSFSPDGSGDTWLLRLDAAGTLVSQKVLGKAGVYDEPISVAAVPGGGAVLGISAYPDAGAWEDLVLRVDDAGEVVHARRYVSGWSWTNALVPHDDGAVSVVGVYWGGDPAPDLMDLWVLRLDGTGALSSCDRVEDVSLQTADTDAVPAATAAMVRPTMVAPADAEVTVTVTDDRARFYCGP